MRSDASLERCAAVRLPPRAPRHVASHSGRPATRTPAAPCGRRRGCIAQERPFAGGTMDLPRGRFFLSSLPRESVSVRGIHEGSVAISGTHSSSLLVADALAARGHQVGVVTQGGQKLTDTAVRVFVDLAEAVRWTGRAGRVVWCSWG